MKRQKANLFLGHAILKRQKNKELRETLKRHLHVVLFTPLFASFRYAVSMVWNITNQGTERDSCEPLGIVKIGLMYPSSPMKLHGTDFKHERPML